MTDRLRWHVRQMNSRSVPSVNARELYDVLGIARPGFPAWIKLKVKAAQLQEDADFVIRARKMTTYTGGRPVQDYYLAWYAAAQIAQMSGAANAAEVERWCLAQAPQLTEPVPVPSQSELIPNTPRSVNVDERERQAISSYIPEHDDDSESIPRRQLTGWVRIKYIGGKTEVLKVETVRVVDSVFMNILYPPQRKDYPVYERSFPAVRIECIPEAEALTWLTKRGLPLPDHRDGEVRANTVPDEEAS
jgi:phage anti-repressor protein